MRVLFVVCTLALFFMMPSTAWAFASPEAQYSTDGGSSWTESSFTGAVNFLNKSTNGGTIKLSADVTLGDSVNISKNISIISVDGAVLSSAVAVAE